MRARVRIFMGCDTYLEPKIYIPKSSTGMRLEAPWCYDRTAARCLKSRPLSGSGYAPMTDCCGGFLLFRTSLSPEPIANVAVATPATDEVNFQRFLKLLLCLANVCYNWDT